MYLRGKGVPKNYTEAYNWVKKAEEQGVPLAKHYLRFISFMENIRKANKWFKNTTRRRKEHGHFRV